MNRIVRVIALLYLIFSTSTLRASTVKLYNWWNYLSPSVVENLKSSGIKLNLITYMSNSQAISRIYSNRDDFDFAIVSTATLDSLDKYDLFDRQALKPILKERKYNKLTKENDYCLPFLWGATVFVYRNIESEKDFNSSDIPRFIERGVKVHLIDDPAEFFSMFKADSTCNELDCFVKKYETLSKVIGPVNFKSEVNRSDLTEKYFFYGWFGAIADLVATESNNLSVKIPNNVVVGQDSLCLLKNSKLKLSDKQRFARILTNQINTNLNEEFSGYYSPFLKQNKLSSSKSLLKVKEEIINKVNKEKFIKIPSADDVTFRSLHKSWMKVRYE